MAGLALAMKFCERNGEATVVSYQSLKRSHSVCAQGGINAAIDAKNEGDTPEKHFYDTIKGGDFLAHQPLVRDMCYQGPTIIHLMDRMGVAFNRTGEGHLDFRRFGGTLYNRTAFAGATTGQQLVYALDEQVRRHVHDGSAKTLEWHEYLGAVLDSEEICRGAVIHDLRTDEIYTLKADAVVLATGGPGQVYGRSTNSVVNTGAAATTAYMQGAKFANGEFIQIHPTAIPGQDKLRLMSESARGEGGRVWVPRKANDNRNPKEIPENERYYFLEEKYPLFKNLVPRDVACREIYDIVYNQNLGISGDPMVYLDLTHKSRKFLDNRLGGILDIYTKFTGVDPRETPMKIFPAVHYSMGGLWTDYGPDSHGMIDHGSPKNQMTSIRGLYAAGEVDYQYHGANRLGASALMQGLADGYFVLPYTIGDDLAGLLGQTAVPTDDPVFTKAVRGVEDEQKRWLSINGTRSVDQFHKQLGRIVWEHIGMERDKAGLEQALTDIPTLREEFHSDVRVLGSAATLNQSLEKAGRVADFFELAELMARDALEREESCGGHFRSEHQTDEGEAQRDDENFAHVAAWEWHSEGTAQTRHREELSFEDVALSQRSYK